MLLHSKIIGAGQPMLILHGFLGMGDNWKSISDKIAVEEFEVHLIDARNHGRSFQSEEFSYEVMVKDLYEYCKQFNITSYILLGHSMGGKTAMLFAVKYPALVAKLIIVDIAPRYYPIHHQDILKGLREIDAQILTSREEADKMLSKHVSDLGTRQFLLKNLYWTPEKILKFRFNLNVLRHNVAEVGEALPPSSIYKEPTIFIKGERSEYISKTDEIEIKHHFPMAEILSVSGAGHWLHAENPKEFLEKLMPFLLK